MSTRIRFIAVFALTVVVVLFMVFFNMNQNYLVQVKPTPNIDVVAMMGAVGIADYKAGNYFEAAIELDSAINAANLDRTPSRELLLIVKKLTVYRASSKLLMIINSKTNQLQGVDLRKVIIDGTDGIILNLNHDYPLSVGKLRSAITELKKGGELPQVWEDILINFEDYLEDSTQKLEKPPALPPVPNQNVPPYSA